MTTKSTICRLKESLVLREEGEEGGFLFDPATLSQIILNRTGCIVVKYAQERSDNVVELDQFAEGFAEKYERQPEEVMEDMTKFMEQLRAYSMLAADEDGQRP